MSSSTTTNKENSTDDESGMRYRGHRNSKVGNNPNKSKSDFSNNHPQTSNNHKNDDDDNTSNINSNNTNSQHHGGAPPTDEEMAKPLLAHDYAEGDESTNRGADSGNNNASSSDEGKTSLMTAIAGIARKVRCKFLDKMPISFATKFAVAGPPEPRVAVLRKFI